jgi:hypothetical protein
MYVCIDEKQENKHLAKVREILTLPFNEDEDEGSTPN